MSINKGLLQSQPFFASLEISLLVILVGLLKPLKAERGSVIYRRNDRANYIHFLTDGRIEFYLEHLQVTYKSMIEGSYFGDYEVICKILRQHTVRARVDSNILTLSKESFKGIIETDYPDVCRKMTIEARNKHRRTNRCLKVAIKNARKEILRLNELAFDKMHKENINIDKF